MTQPQNSVAQPSTVQPSAVQNGQDLYLLTTTEHAYYSLHAPSLGEAIRTARARGYFSGGLHLGNLDLSGTCLSGLHLAGSWLWDSRLGGADLSGSDLLGSNLTGADFSGANLAGACLQGVKAICADFTGADLSGADLRNVNLRATGLRGANLRGALLAFTTVGAALSTEQIFQADTEAVRLDLFDRLNVTPGLAGQLEAALRGGFFLGQVRGRLPEGAVTGSALGPEQAEGGLPPCGAARHWLEEVFPHTPAADPRVALILAFLARWHSEHN